MTDFKMPKELDERLVRYVVRDRERGSGYENVCMVWGKKKGPTFHDPFWKLEGKGTATYRIMSTLKIGDNRWLVAMFIPNNYLGLSEYIVAEYWGSTLIDYTPAPEMQDTFIVKSTATSERILADFAEDKQTGKLTVDWVVLRPVDLPQTHVEVFDQRTIHLNKGKPAWTPKI